MTPTQRYQQDLDRGTIEPDDMQWQIVCQLQELFDELSTDPQLKAKPTRKLLSWFSSKPDNSNRGTGLYIWGGVGRGKTYLVDLFYDCLPQRRKLRTHFHRFMQSVHRELVALTGTKNPLQQVARNIASEAEIICFDEFFVSDIGDAMILAGLLEELFRLEVVLVATSNIAPDLLYYNGLQRDRFLPAIALIKQHTKVVEVAAGVDYRLRSLSQATLYHHPLSAEADQQLLLSFKQLAPDLDEAEESAKIEILGRLIDTRFCVDDVVWFDFQQLCGGPRSAFDYVEIARMYHALLLGNVPQMLSGNEDHARRFISLIDELYDRNVKLVMAAAVPLQELYVGSVLAFEFERTRSRLSEMQSHEYLSREHKP